MNVFFSWLYSEGLFKYVKKWGFEGGRGGGGGGPKSGKFGSFGGVGGVLKKVEKWVFGGLAQKLSQFFFTPHFPGPV